MRLAFFGSALLATLMATGNVTPAAAQGEQPADAWVKICNSDPKAQKKVCLITQELRTEQGQFLASIAIRETPGEARKTVIASIPVGMLVQPGVQIQIDGGEPTEAKYTICFPNACYAELAIDNGFVNRLKAGGKLQLTTFNQQGKQVRFDMTLIGFTSAYDSEGVDPTEIAQRTEELQKSLEAKALEARNKLVAEQRKALEEANSE
ncbi:MAG: invasion associated locus B family protein [Pseudomonadota bacterium]